MGGMLAMTAVPGGGRVTSYELARAIAEKLSLKAMEPGWDSEASISAGWRKGAFWRPWTIPATRRI